jgi:ABC-type polysaccharide/polyol phosphate transport system ATPase subunit
MSSELAIEARGLTKVYDTRSLARGGFIDHVLGRVLGRSGAAPAGRPAVDSVDLDIAAGETVGILGVNGAGKTTLLSMLSGVLKPTSGWVRRRGRLLPLLGVGTSLMHELSGRENAEMSLIMMGVPRREARRRVADIEAFADVGHHFDAPLWTYSSGMVARVAFAAALHVDADTLVLDETLSVGDAAFREKCTAALEDFKRQGRTILLVTHNPPLIAKMCTRGLVMDRGRLVFDGAPREAVKAYTEIRAALDRRKVAARAIEAPAAAKRAEFSGVKFETRTGADGTPLGIVTATLVAQERIDRPTLGFTVRATNGVVLARMPAGPVAGLDALAPDVARKIELTFPQRFLRSSYVGELVVGEGDDNAATGVFAPVASHSFRFDVIADGSVPGQAGYLDLSMRIEAEMLLDRLMREEARP